MDLTEDLCQAVGCDQPATHARVSRRGRIVHRYCPAHAPARSPRLPIEGAADPAYAAIAAALAGFCARHRGASAGVDRLRDGRILVRVRCPWRVLSRTAFESLVWEALGAVPLSALRRLADLLVIHPDDRDAGYELALFNLDTFAGELGELAGVIGDMTRACRLGAPAPSKPDITRWRDRLRAVAARLPERLRQRRGRPRCVLPLRRDLP